MEGRELEATKKKGVIAVLFYNHLILFKPYIFWVPDDIAMGGE